jgi:hypothetical protein
MTDVAIVGGSEETRLLLRGLTRLHHHRVVFEGAAPDSLKDLPAGGDALTILFDVDIDSTDWPTPIGAALKAHPARRGILIAPTRSPRIEQRAKELGFAAVLRRPFAVHELVEVLQPTPSGPPSGPSGPHDPPV